MNLERSKPLFFRFFISALAIIAIYFSVSYSYTPTGVLLIPILIAAVSSLASAEYYALAVLQGRRPQKVAGITALFLYIFVVFIAALDPRIEYLCSLFISVSIILILLACMKNKGETLSSSAVTLFPLVYIALPMSCIIRINYFQFYDTDGTQDGRVWLLYLLAITYATDSFALFFGKLFGRKKLAPLISPHKTWEGAIGGVAMATAISFIFHLLSKGGSPYLPMRLELWTSIFLGILLSVLAQIGDLAESQLKRDSGEKDSGHIPGLGGVLDTLDSLLFTAPVLYLYLKCG